MINIFKKKGVETEKKDADKSASEQATNENEVETCKEDVNTDQPCKPKKNKETQSFYAGNSVGKATFGANI